VNPDGTWRLAWYTSSIKGVEKMQTARYYFTAADLSHPEFSSTTTVLMKKAEFYATISPNPAMLDEYVSVTGSSERGVSYVRIDITDNTGKVIRTYTSPVSASGYFDYGFHVDMAPGQYTITVSNPAIKNPLQMPLVISPPRTQNPVEINGTVSQGDTAVSITDSIPQTTGTSQNLPGIPAVAGALSIASTPSGASVYLDSVMMGKTPIDLGNLNYGTHLVEIKTPGYLPYSVQVTVSEGVPVTLSPLLLKSPSAIPLSPFMTLIGLIICGSIVLAWKRK
jgi:hypothetical protein